MRLSLFFFTAIAALSVLSLPATAATVGTSTIIVGLGQSSIRLSFLPPANDDGSFRGSSSVVLCGSSIREASACNADETFEGLVHFSFEGSIFPFIHGTVSFTDAGGPTSLGVTFSTLIPSIAGPAETELSGNLTVPQSPTNPPPILTGLFGFPFVTGGVLGDSVLAVATVPDSSITLTNSPFTLSWPTTSSVFDCELADGCAGIYVFMGFDGLGGGTEYQISGRFDIDAVTPIPLPASAALLGAALGALGFAARRRREGRAGA